MNAPKDYVVIDTETTGLPERDRWDNQDFSKVCITEIAMLLVRDGCGVATFKSLVKIPSDCKYEPKAEEVSGLSREQLESEGDYYSAVVARAKGWLKEKSAKDLPVVGQNVIRFDLPLLVDLFGYGRDAFDTKLLWGAYATGRRKHLSESLSYFWGLIEGNRYRGRSSLDYLVQTLCGKDVWAGYEGSNHRAFTDCCMTNDVFSAMVNGVVWDSVMGEG